MTGKVLHSLGELGEAMDTKKFTKGPLPSCEPVFIRRLVEFLGTHDAAGREIGISGSHVSESLRKNSVKISYDLAAKAIIMEMEREKARPNFYLVEVPSAQKEFLDTFLNNMKMKWTMV